MTGSGKSFINLPRPPWASTGCRAHCRSNPVSRPPTGHWPGTMSGRATAPGPDNIDACLGLARVYTRIGDFERANETYVKALAKHPRDLAIWHDLGMMHNRRKDWTEAARCFRKALEIDPENQRCLKALGFTLARAGQVEQSVGYLTRAMGSAAAAHYNVAMMLLPR